ncbi:PI31 proteasome regulator [Kalmanozyma brasiliensis GHG001]|uniref:Uncharacterized protein n=1 Tax=Kalmanozyma brasiliensis (strain GHG001) TaxID=1365824 RepID=V5EPN2_KALBG|nr:PI31 proteasome regulator [Kalmanozyma brasiliensis GHG001]EST04903.1 PI31 proteasome regulator [Kalmanozyma brasiliensis GHG001]
MSDPLDPAALLQVLPTLLPSTDGPQLQNASDALAALIHTVLTRLDFRLTGLSEDDRLPISSSPSNQLPPNWNASSPAHHSFRYKHHQSSLDFLIKIVKLHNKALIHGIALQGTKTSTMEVVLTDFISTNFWPYPNGGNEPLVNGYIGSSRVKDLVGSFKAQVLSQLVPGLRKDGYVEESSSTSTSGASGSGDGNQGGSGSTPRQPPPPAPRAPFHGDEDDPSQPTSLPPFRNPLIIGDRDLDPLGGSPLALPPRFGGGSSAPPPLFPGSDTGGGMYVGPDHPMFRNRHPPSGGSQGLPPGAVPPGARFDPIYPGGAGPGPFRPGAGGPDVGGPRPQTGEPDWDELRPPGMEDAFGAGRGGFGSRGGFGGGRGGRGGFGGGADTSGWYA